MLPEGRKRKLMIQRWHCLVLWTRRKSNENLCCRKLPQRDHSSTLLGKKNVEKFIHVWFEFMKLLRNQRKKLTNLIKVERIISWHWAVESRLQECRPSVAESMWSTFVPFTDTCNTREDCLRGTERNYNHESTRMNTWDFGESLPVKKTCCMAQKISLRNSTSLMTYASWRSDGRQI